MRTLFFTIFFVLFALLPSYSQAEPKTIQISNDIQLIRISNNAWVHVSFAEISGFGRFSSNGLVIISQGKAFLFDTPVNNELTELLLKGINDSLNVEITGFIPNHWHNDCMGGLEYLHQQEIKSYANQMTINIAKEKGITAPQNGFVDSLKLDFGDLEIQCFYLGAGHSLDNIVVWIPSEKILFPGCLVKELRSVNLGNTADGDLSQYPITINKVFNKFSDARIVIPGHGLFGGPELIKHTSKLASRQKL